MNESTIITKYVWAILTKDEVSKLYWQTKALYLVNRLGRKLAKKVLSKDLRSYCLDHMFFIKSFDSDFTDYTSSKADWDGLASRFLKS